MTAHYVSRHGEVAKPRETLYMAFTDLRNFQRFVPPQYQADIVADFDSLRICVQGFAVAVRVDVRQPYELIGLGSAESPVEFAARLHFDAAPLPGKTDFWIELDVNLNFMMKTMFGNKIQQGLDKLVAELVRVSEGGAPDFPAENL
ncbi:MAG: hypothetical protein J5871_04185 [Bacteroidales bacterium]|nr:hypothetical protein [Bacteroidales bacterium]